MANVQQFAFDNLLSELEEWFDHGTEKQREDLIASLGSMMDAIHEEMPDPDIDEYETQVV